MQRARSHPRTPRSSSCSRRAALLGNFSVSLLNDIGIGALVALGLVLLTGVGGAPRSARPRSSASPPTPPPGSRRAQGCSPWLGLLFALALTGLAAAGDRRADAAPRRPLPAAHHHRLGLSIALLFGNVDALGRHTGISDIPPLTIGRLSLAEPRAIYYLIWACWSAWPCCFATTCCSRARARDPQPARRRGLAREPRRRRVPGAARSCSSSPRCSPASPAGSMRT